MPDTNFVCHENICFDTNQVFIFGTLRKSKQIGMPYVSYNPWRRYAYNIGIIQSFSGCYFNGYIHFYLQGSVINNILYGDTSYPVGINSNSSEIPNKFSLLQNYPNPFNPNTKITYQIPKSIFIKLTIYDVLGNEISVLVNEEQNPGTYEAEWNALNFPSGIYFYKLQAGDFIETKKMTLIK